MIKAVLFDIDNTLLSFDEYVKESMKIGFEKFGLESYNDEMFAAFTQINSKLWRLLEKGELTFKVKRESYDSLFS